VILGDPGKFLAEHSDKEPALVLVKPVVDEPAESNLLVTTTKGRQVSFVLHSDGVNSKQVDYLLIYKPMGTFLIEESDLGTLEVPRTERIATGAPIGASVRPVSFPADPGEDETERAGKPIP
jgi:hypothetical protein